MQSEEIINHSMPELFEMLGTHTKKLLELLDNMQPNEKLVTRQKNDVQMINSVIERRKTELNFLPLSPLARF